MNSVADLVGIFIVLDVTALAFAQIINMRQTGVAFTLDLLSPVSPIKLTTIVTFYVIICSLNVNNVFLNFLYDP